MFTCKAETDRTGERYCRRCGFRWDADDPEPPQCKTDKDIRIERGRRELHKIKELVKHD